MQLPSELESAINKWREADDPSERNDAWLEMGELQASYSIPTEELPEDVKEYNFKKDEEKISFQEEERPLPYWDSLDDMKQHTNIIYSSEWDPEFLDTEIQPNSNWESSNTPFGAEKVTTKEAKTFWHTVSPAKTLIYGGFMIGKDSANDVERVYDWANNLNRESFGPGDPLIKVIEDEIGEPKEIGAAISWQDESLVENAQAYATMLFYGTYADRFRGSKNDITNDMKKLSKMSMDLLEDNIAQKMREDNYEGLADVVYLGSTKNLKKVHQGLSHLIRKWKATTPNMAGSETPRWEMTDDNWEDIQQGIENVKEIKKKVGIPNWLQAEIDLINKIWDQDVIKLNHYKADEPLTYLPLTKEQREE